MYLTCRGIAIDQFACSQRLPYFSLEGGSFWVSDQGKTLALLYEVFKKLEEFF
jgi:hypothetical protein